MKVKTICLAVGLVVAVQSTVVLGAAMVKEGAAPLRPVVTPPSGVIRAPAYMDACEVELRKQLQGTGVSVQRAGQEITLMLPGNITFRSGSDDIQPSFYEVLNSIGLTLKKYARTSVDISGHMDNTGTDQQALSLSQNRASAVAQYLYGRGLAMDRTSVSGYGKSRPIAGNETDAGRAQNRRVEILLAPGAAE